MCNGYNNYYNNGCCNNNFNNFCNWCVGNAFGCCNRCGFNNYGYGNYGFNNAGFLFPFLFF